MTLPVTLAPCPLAPLARRRLPSLVVLVGPGRSKEHCLVDIGLLLTPVALDAWGMGSPDHCPALLLGSLHVALHCSSVAAHDGRLSDGHCLQRLHLPLIHIRGVHLFYVILSTNMSEY